MLSMFTAAASRLAVPSKCAMLVPKHQGLMALSLRESHGHLFRKRQGQLYMNRIKDICHFYFIGIGLLPFTIFTYGVHMVFGPCELHDYPDVANGEAPPRFWQFERTTARQWFTRYFQTSDMEQLERNLSYVVRQEIRMRWRRMEQRVKHLQGERWDYKGYYYQPVSATWVQHSRKIAERLHYEYEEHGHYVA